MTVAHVESAVAGEVLRHHPRSLVRAMNRESVERESQHGRMPLAIVGEWRLHTTWILVIMVHASLLGMTAAGIEPDLGIPLNGVHATRLERIEEDHAVERHADGPHGDAGDLVRQAGLDRQSEVEVLHSNPVRISAVGKYRRGVVRIPLAVQHQGCGVVTNGEVRNAVLVRVGLVIAKEVDIRVRILENVGRRVPFSKIPVSAKGLQPIRRIKHCGRRRFPRPADRARRLPPSLNGPDRHQEHARMNRRLEGLLAIPFQVIDPHDLAP